MKSGIRKINEMCFTVDGRNLAGHYDAQELDVASKLFLLARASGLHPLRLHQGFRSFSPILTCEEGQFLGSSFMGKWELVACSSEDDRRFFEDGYPEVEYFDYGED